MRATGRRAARACRPCSRTRRRPRARRSTRPARCCRAARSGRQARARADAVSRFACIASRHCASSVSSARPAVAARARDERIDAAEAFGDPRQEACPVGGARGIAGQREAARFGGQRVERRLAPPISTTRSPGEAARASGADTGARAGDRDRAGCRVGHVVLRKGVVSGHFRRRRRAPVSAERMNAGGIRAAGAVAGHFAKADDVRRRIALSSTFCDKSRKPGRIARAGRASTRAPAGRFRRASGAAGRRSRQQRTRARALHRPGIVSRQPIARLRARVPDHRQEQGGPAMRLDDERESTNVEDRRGAGGFGGGVARRSASARSWLRSPRRISSGSTRA